VSSAPDSIVLRRHRDLQGRRRDIWARRAILGAIALFCLLGLLNVFGQRPTTTATSTGPAKLSIYAPTTVRGGVLFSARFHVTAHQDLKKAMLVLDPGWAEGMSINTIEPSPVGEASDNGKLSLELGHIPAGTSYILFMQFQVNPTNVAWHRPQDVSLYDGQTLVLTIHRSLTVYP
jgi:hypothetical protein